MSTIIMNQNTGDKECTPCSYPLYHEQANILL